MKLNHPIGKAAEDNTLNFLEKQGCVLVARNWHCPFGEIDLIMRHGETLLFIEVKYRKNRAFGGAALSITPSKMQKLQRSIEYYLQQNHCHHLPCRLDAVLIEGAENPQWIHNLTG